VLCVGGLVTYILVERSLAVRAKGTSGKPTPKAPEADGSRRARRKQLVNTAAEGGQGLGRRLGRCASAPAVIEAPRPGTATVHRPNPDSRLLGGANGNSGLAGLPKTRKLVTPRSKDTSSPPDLTATPTNVEQA